MFKFFTQVFPEAEFGVLLAFIQMFSVGAPLTILSKLFKKNVVDLDAMALLVGLAAERRVFKNDDELLAEIYKSYDKAWPGRKAHNDATRAALLEMQTQVQKDCSCPNCRAKQAAQAAVGAPGLH